MTAKILQLVTPSEPDDDLTPVDGLARGRSPRYVAEQLRARRCPPDRAFDRYLPRELCAVSGQYWTPLEVAVRAAEWLDEAGVRTVVDIGSGVGKFCVAAALAGRSELTGIEQRARLVDAARDLARLFGCEDRVRFVVGAFGETPLPKAEAYYLYNPFGENLFGFADQLDDDVELGEARLARDLAATHALLEQAPAGTYLLTYNGFGGRVPAAYREVHTDRELPNVLRLWQKAEPEPRPGVEANG